MIPLGSGRRLSSGSCKLTPRLCVVWHYLPTPHTQTDDRSIHPWTQARVFLEEPCGSPTGDLNEGMQGKNGSGYEGNGSRERSCIHANKQDSCFANAPVSCKPRRQ